MKYSRTSAQARRIPAPASFEDEVFADPSADPEDPLRRHKPMKNKKRTAGLLLILTGTMMILSAAGYVGYHLYTASRAGRDAEEILKEIEAALPAADLTTSAQGHFQDPGREMPTIEIRGRSYIGILEVPSLSLKLPVLSEWSYDGLRIAPCRYSGSLYSRDLVIAGHNYRKHFAGIKSLPAGSEVLFTDVEGRSCRFEVSESQVIRPADVDGMIINTDHSWDMTLFTCTSGGSARCALRCSLTY